MSGETIERERGDEAYGPIERELGHDEYDPIGTVALIALYFVVLALMWLFMFFVEFLGNDPTVIGSAATVVGVA